MKLLKKIKRFFTPKKKFSPVYYKQTDLIKNASTALLEMSQTTDEYEWKRLEKVVKLCETQGDALLVEFYEDLYSNIDVTIDITELQMIAVRLDDFLDHINNASKSILLYMPKKIDVQLVEIAQYILNLSLSLEKSIAYFDDYNKNASEIGVECARITELEHAADDAYAEYIGYIFNNEKDFIELMKYKNIAETLEATTDVGKSISDHLRRLLLHYVIK